LLVSFDNAIKASQIPAFRAAVIEKVGREHILFHNHLGETEYSYRYPLIQYKTVQQRPAIFCVDAGVEAIHQLFENKSWTIQFLGEPMHLKVADLFLKTTTLNVWNETFSYYINHWQALNEDNYAKFKLVESLSDRIAMLEKILTGNILSMAKGIDWHIDKRLDVKITDMEAEKLSRMKDIKVATFNLRFQSNIFLPDYIGLGKGASKGFGIVKHIRKKENA
jgi:hypothetical protein